MVALSGIISRGESLDCDFYKFFYSTTPIRIEIGEKTEFTVTEPYLYQGYSVQTHGKNKLITVNALSSKQPCSELKGYSESV